MDSRWLAEARDVLSRLLDPAPLVVAAGVRPPCGAALDLEWPAEARRERLVLDTDAAHPTLHLAGRARRASDPGAPSPLTDPLVGRRLTAVRAIGGEPILVLAFSAPALDPAASALELVVEWTGHRGNARLVGAGGIVVATLRRAGVRPGEAYAPPARPAGSVPTGTDASPSSAQTDEAAVPAEEVFERLRKRHDESLLRAEAEARRREQRRAIRSEVKRLLRLRARLLEERGDSDQGARLRRSGEAILSHLHAIRRGDAELVAPGWGVDGGELRVALDPARSAVDSAEGYFRRARRWERGEPHRRRRLEEIDRAVARLSVLENQVAESERPPGNESFATRLDEALGLFRRPRPAPAATETAARGPADRPRRRSTAGPARGAPRASGRKGSDGRRAAARSRGEPARRPRAFTTSDGWTVLVGRSNEENDWLTHRFAHPEDIWLHAHGVPGSHVVLRREGRKSNPSAKTLEEAAAIAAFYSKARHSSKVPVVYTLRKHVRKPRGAKAGLAVCERERSILVRPKDPTEGREPEWMED